MNTSTTTPDASAPWQPSGLINFVRFMAGRIRWRWLLLPVIPAVIFSAAFDSLPFTGLLTKNGLESAAIAILSITLGQSVLRGIVTRRAFFVWTSFLIGALLFREFHLHKTATTITYILVVVLAVIMWRCYPLVAAYMHRPLVPTLLAMMVTCYCISQSLDFDYFKYNYPHIPKVEEIMELLGHSCVSALICTAQRASDYDLPSS